MVSNFTYAYVMLLRRFIRFLLYMIGGEKGSGGWMNKKWKRCPN